MLRRIDIDRKTCVGPSTYAGYTPRRFPLAEAQHMDPSLILNQFLCDRSAVAKVVAFTSSCFTQEVGSVTYSAFLLR